MRKFLHYADTLIPIAFWVIIMFGFDSVSVTIMTLLSAAIHEFGHIAVISQISGQKVSLPIPKVSGMRIKPSRILSYKEEILVAFGGPCANLVFSALLIPFYRISHGYAVTFAIINLMTALSNLLPVSGFDGYKIALAAASLKFGSEHSERILHVFSFIFSSVSVFVSLYLILKIGEGYWIFGIFFIAMLSEVFKRNKLVKTKNKRDFARF